jgi:hypothetical protein
MKARRRRWWDDIDPDSPRQRWEVVEVEDEQLAEILFRTSVKRITITHADSPTGVIETTWEKFPESEGEEF